MDSNSEEVQEEADNSSVEAMQRPESMWNLDNLYGMKAAVESGDMQALQEILNSNINEDPLTAKRLKALAKNYDYISLSTWLDLMLTKCCG